MKLKHGLFFLSFFLCGVLVSCKDDDNGNNGNNGGTGAWTEQQKTEYINEWIYDNMSIYYYWNEHLLELSKLNTASDSEDFFESLLYNPDTRNGDRFSWIQKNYIDLLNALSGYSSSEMGFDYGFVRYEDNGPIYARVLYVKHGTAAETKGLKRGMDIATVNGKAMTASNYQSVLSSNLLSYKLGIKTTGQIIEFKPDADYAENPIYLDSVYVEGDKVVGYLVYNFFARGAHNTTYEYDEQLMQVLTRFKAEGVNNLVLDLRYNSGGAVSSATCLASALVPNRKTSNVFVNYEYNKLLMDNLGNDDKYEYFVNKAGKETVPNLGDQLEKLYIITGERSASASELIINGLNSFMKEKIELIGETTYGKNVASVTFIETDKKYTDINKCGMQPIIAKLSNADGYSDYVDGFTPKYYIEEMWETMPELGDKSEVLLATALSLITGQKSAVQQRVATVKGVSLEKSDRNYNMYIDSEKFKGLRVTE